MQEYTYIQDYTIYLHIHARLHYLHSQAILDA